MNDDPLGEELMEGRMNGADGGSKFSLPVTYELAVETPERGRCSAVGKAGDREESVMSAGNRGKNPLARHG